MTRNIRWIRLAVGFIVGVIGGVAFGIWLGPAAGWLAGWTIGAGVVVVWILLVVWPMDGPQTRAHARLEDPGRRVARLINVVGSVASLAGVVVVVVQSGSANALEKGVMAGIVVLGVIASWFLIQVDAMLRYARMYYRDPEGGIDFNQDEEPAYVDFAYVSFGVGLTYQIADTNIKNPDIRRFVVGQSLLGYVFGSVILATIINLITSLA